MGGRAMICERMIKLAEGGSAIRAMFEEGKRDVYKRQGLRWEKN